jgi:mono/diheme cytochrome c family protein
MVSPGRAVPGLILVAVLAGGCDRTSVAEGEIVYQRFCAACHGMTGHGDGPAAAALTPPPTDLTRLTYDLDELMRRIDGRETIRAHGISRMPVWGEVFARGVVGDDSPSRRALMHLQAAALYVKTLQKGG